MIKVGDPLPAGSFRVKNDDQTVTEITAEDYFGGKTIVLVGVPGAFTSTCHNAHVPQFVDNAGAIKSKGVDRIAVLSTNDHHVMKVWAEALSARGKLDFLADGSGEFTRALGLEVDMRAGGLGKRCKRFSALVKDGVVTSLHFEPEGARGISATGAAVILGEL